jgi:hypothetical protein
MKKNLLAMILFVVFVVGLTACAKQSTAPVTISTPATKLETKIVVDQEQLNKFLEKWPVLNSMKQARALGLQEVTLTEPCWGFNLLNKQKENPYRLQQLETGTKVWEDANGIPRYISDCLNPFYVPTKTELVSVAPAPVVTSPIIEKDFWATGFGTVLAWILMALAILLGLLLISYLAFGIACVNRHIFRTLRWAVDRDRDSTPVNPQSSTAWSMNVSCDRNRRIHVDLNGVESFSIGPLNKGTAIEAQIPAEKKTPRR